MTVLSARCSIVVWIALTGLTSAEDAVDYLRDVKPILRERCYACHGALKQAGGLRLDTGADLRRGGESGAAIDADTPADSLLLQVVTGDAGFRMPPPDQGTPLSADEIAVLRRWVNAGGPSPENEARQTSPQEYWSYRSPQRPDIPRVAHPEWVRTPVDAFIAARHDELGLSPSPEASREIWLRRVFYDLVGLPPTRDELHAFLADDSSDACERVVDDLLNRPQYGERWGRHWMDVWRYSDWYGSRGINEIRYSQRHIWRWRDWIVESLNADVGYDQMVREMLAGDELAPDDPEVLRATGFLARNWYKFDRNVWMFDAVEHTAQAFLGVTLRCARCHDHKFDPISQEDYYRFRAFFEPHQVRTETLSLRVGTEKDATLGMVPKDGVARVFDRDLEVPTYLFERGDDRYPVKDQPLSPAAPASLGGDAIAIEAVDLPASAYYPALQPRLIAERIRMAEEAVTAADKARQAAHEAVAVAEAAVTAARTQAAQGSEPPPAYLQDNFSAARPDVWQVVSGNWVYEEGRLLEKSVGSFATMVTKANHPRDFRARAVYRPLQPGTYRSVGFSFDYIDQGNSQDVYTSTGDASQSVQAFHRQDGRQMYPPAGIVKTPLTVGAVTTLEWEVRGSQLRLWLNGEHKLDYVLPVPRRDGRFALWVHAGSAEFLSLEVTALTPTVQDLERVHRDALDKVARTAAERTIAELELQSVQARIAAEQAKYFAADTERVQELALAASRAERQVAVAKAEAAVLAAEQQVAALNALATNPPATSEPAMPTPAEKQLAAARAALTTAEQAVQAADGTYEPLGEIYPRQSTGRRRALAEWITRADHPRTARVAVNQIWMRHFGEPLVASVANFGMNGAAPTHPELLDWLASELVANGWRMKPLHRQIVLSATYRQSSSGAATNALQVDPQNRFHWRMNSQRMQAEVVRDSVLYLSGALDLARGGPEIPEKEGETVLRRSLYFRNTPNEKMTLLATFDMANPNQCYRRQESVVPQQALALMNSGLALDQSRNLAEQLTVRTSGDGGGSSEERFIALAFETILNRSPTEEEVRLCRQFLAEHVSVLQAGGDVFSAGGGSRRAPAADPVQRARENLVHVLFSHNEFVTIR